jgi:molybdopterin-containing oxidoreductase family membrane subunit
MALLRYESQVRPALVEGDKDYHQVTEDICRPVEAKPTKAWWIGFIISVLVLCFGILSVTMEVIYGTGQWNLNRTVGWGWDITNFVWWIGIGHAGTLISAILLLFRQGWRTGVNRAAGSNDNICGNLCWASFLSGTWVVCGMHSLYCLIPNTRGPLWINFNSPLLWDVFAISTYFTVSLLFWYTGLLPDLATLRDRARKKWRKMFYGLAAFGWTGSTKHWQRHEALALVLAGLSTPLVLSVHTIVSFDFATSVVPGWHTTIFPPYFVAGAIFSGFAMVQTLLVVTRKVLALEEYITLEHIDVMNKVIVLTGSIVGIAYLTELFIAWYSAAPYEWFAFKENRVNLLSPYGWSYWIMMFCNVMSPQIFWFRKMRRNLLITFFMSILINIGMWFERFVIIVTSVYRDYLPSAWSTYYRPTIWEVGFYMGTFGLFFTCYFLFSKFFPVIALAEIKHILKRSGENYKEKMDEVEHESVDKFVEHHGHDHGA